MNREEVMDKRLDHVDLTIHITVLTCTEAVIERAVARQDKESYGWTIDSLEAILCLLVEKPWVITETTSADGDRIHGVRLKDELFEPIEGIELTEEEKETYKKALSIYEKKLRSYCDSCWQWTGKNARGQ
jgi:hypothetical protein